MLSRRKLLLALAGLTVSSPALAAAPPGTSTAKKPAPKKTAARKPAPKKTVVKKVMAKKRLVISINKVSQKVTVELDGSTKFKWPVSTGASGYETPSGTYRPFRMEKEHFSKEWDDAPMPHSIFFTAQGHAVHGSFHVKSLGRRASHGCVRLEPGNAAKLFALVQQTGMANTTVVVRGGLFDSGTTIYSPNKTGKRRLFPWLDRQ